MCNKFINVVFIVVIFFSYYIQIGSSIRCYQCFLAERPYYIDESTLVKTCNDFDYSDNYIVNCPESTFCYKKTVKDHFYKTDYVQEERGCAQQVYRGQKFNSILGWTSDSYVVSNAYQKGCKAIENYGLRTLNLEECYCDNGNLCNSARRNYSSLGLLGCVVVILIICCIK